MAKDYKPTMIIKVKITPNASKNSIEGYQGDLLRIRIAAPPDKNKANEELIAFLAKTLSIPKSHIKILSGHTSRLKRLEIQGSHPLQLKFGHRDTETQR